MKQATIAFFIPHLGCPQMCTFCNQRDISGRDTPPTAADVKTTCTQAVAALGGANRTKRVEIAFFGGSFTAIERGYMLELLGAAAPFVADGLVDGIRISTRPDAIDEDVLTVLQAHHVTTIELGAQSMDDHVLQLAARGHTAAAVERAARLIHGFGFRLGLQMMLGLRGDTPEGAVATAQKLIALAPKEMRIYPTVVLRGTELAAEYARGLYTPLTLEEGVATAAHLMELFAGAGIDVIRVGLHASREIEEGMVGGCYHPAFRELCESHLFLREIVAQAAALPDSPAELWVYTAPQNRSKAVGQRRANIEKLRALGYAAHVLPSACLTGNRVVVAGKPLKEV